MTCSCTRTDIIEKEPSIIEDYDPYRSWHGSQYGSRFSLFFLFFAEKWETYPVPIVTSITNQRFLETWTRNSCNYPKANMRFPVGAYSSFN